MNHIADMRSALDFIELNLREQISSVDVARHVHYSLSHLQAVFPRVVGCTVARYIRRRRLSLAAWDLALSQKRVLDIALEYRFESPEAFCRAFRRTYGLSPRDFRRAPQMAAAFSRLGVHRSRSEILKEVERLHQEHAAKPSPAELVAKQTILDGVSRVGFYAGGTVCPEDVPFPSCLAAILRYLGEEYPWTPLHAHGVNWQLNSIYVDLLAASGMAFGLRWRKGWHSDNADLMFVADPRQVIDRAFRQAGYSYTLVAKSGALDDQAIFCEQIRRSLLRGRPVLAFGVIGPPECCLITGINSSGDAVYGWNYFQDNPQFAAGVTTQPSGYFRKDGWFADTYSMLVLEDKLPLESRTPREVLSWGTSVARSPELYGCSTGLAAYRAWQQQLQTEADFSTDDVDRLFHQHEVHNSAVGTVAECRMWASSYLRRLAEGEQGELRADLTEAADCYQQEHDLMWAIWGLVGGNGHPEAHLRLADAGLRRQICEVIEQARVLDETAITAIERYLGPRGDGGVAAQRSGL